MIWVDQTYAGQTVTLPAGQVMELRLPENPTTGFRWVFVVPDGRSCVISGESYQPSKTGMPGAGGEHRWEIRAVAPGTCDLSLAYRRTFESGPPAKSFTIHVRVPE